MKSAQEITELFTERVHSHSAVQTQMRAVRDTYNGDLVLPLPEIDKTEKPSIANLVVQGIDQMATRFASRMPQTRTEAVRAGEAARERADDRNAVFHGYWTAWKLPMQQAQRGRWWFGYGNSASTVLPQVGPRRMALGECPPIPELRSWNPLDAYPAARANVWDLIPEDCIFTTQRSVAWLHANYPAQAASVMHAMEQAGMKPQPDTLFTVLMYIDDTEVVVLVTTAHPRVSHPGLLDAYQIQAGSAHLAGSAAQGFELHRFEHRMGVTPVVHPTRVTLDRITGQFDEILGMYETQAKLHSLNMHAVVRSIFPETWLVQNGIEEIDVAEYPDPARGRYGRLRGGRVEVVQTNPGLLTNNAIDRLERNQRVTAGVPAEFGGESPTNVRTDRRGLTVQGATVDFKLAEAHTVFEHVIRTENMLAAVCDQAWHNTKKMIPVSGFGRRSKVEYTPTELFEECIDHQVTYRYVGSDAAQLTVRLGQKVGAGMMSRETAMENDPDIDDVDAEMDRLTVQQLTDAQIQGLQARVSQGAVPEADVARIIELVEMDRMPLYKAVLQVQKEAQERQAAQAPAGAAELQPGLADAGAGAESAPIPEPPRGIENLRAGLFQLAQTSQLANRI